MESHLLGLTNEFFQTHSVDHHKSVLDSNLEKHVIAQLVLRTDYHLLALSLGLSVRGVCLALCGIGSLLLKHFLSIASNEQL